MIKNLVLVFFCLFVSPTVIATEGLSYYRKLLIEAENNKYAAKLFLEKTEKLATSNDIIFTGFKAMANIMMCKHDMNPITRIGYFNKGKSMLEYAISKEPDNIELIFYRYTVQVNVPSVLGYKSNLKDDKIKMINYIVSQKSVAKKDTELYNNIKSYLLNSSYCTNDEKKLIQD